MRTVPARLKGIVAAGTGGLLVGVILIGLNLIGPLISGGYRATNIVFRAFGILAVILATHPTYQAAQKLDES